MEARVRAFLLDKEVIVNGEKIQVYGLARFSVEPRLKELGRHVIRGLEEIAYNDRKHCIVAFCDDGVLPFYMKCGWHTVGKKDKLNIISSIPLENIEVNEKW